MMCHHCQTDNPHEALECVVCGTKLHNIRHSCSFVNLTSDMFCGGCGQSLIKSSNILKRRAKDEYIEAVTQFSEQELVFLLDLHTQMTATKGKPASVSQEDVDKLFE